MKSTFKQIYSLYKFYLKKLLQQKVEIEYNKILRLLKKNGFVVLDDYYSEKECDELIVEIDNLIKNKRDFFKVELSSNDYRLNGADRFSEKIKLFKKDRFLHSICNNFLKEPSSCFFTLGAKIQKK
jgi:hypothetical protein